MFTLITGAPGSGKTSHLIHRLKDEKRPVYYRGIRNLKLPGWVELSDEEAATWYNHVPDGAIFVLDEAQDIFPQRPLSRPTPEGCSILSKHRHRGWDVFFITQAPTAVDHEARKYVNEHYHYSRSFGAGIVTEYHKGNGLIDLSDKWALKQECNKRNKRLPKSVWGLYHSAEIHTHKFKMPTRAYAFPIAILLVVFLGWRAYAWYSNQQEQALSAAPAIPEATDILPPGTRTVPSPGPVGNWSDMLKSEVRGLPYTAPIYRDIAIKPKAVPVVAGCMSMRADFSDCTCFTQQGTRIADMPVQMCRTVIRDGIFNHLAEPESDSRRADREPRQSADYNI